MRVLLLQTSTWIPAFGGAPKANRALLEGLAELGHRTTAIVPATAPHGSTGRKAFLRLLEEEGVEPTARDEHGVVFEHRGVEVRAVFAPSQLHREAERWIARERPDRVLVSSEDPAQVLLDAALAQRPERVVYIAHTTLNLPFGPDGFLDSRMRRDKLRRVAGVITVSDYLRRYLRRWGGLEATVLRFPVYGEGPFADYGDFERGAVTLVNPCGVKGIDIFCPLAEAFPEAPFLAIPTWGTNAADQARLEALPNVEILPPFTDVEQLFARTRILLVPSLWGEAFGQICIEAMLHGLPVVASDVGGLPEAKLGVEPILPVRPIERYRDQLDERRLPIPVIPEQDLEPWRDSLGELLHDRETYERLSRASRQAAHRFVEGLGVEPFADFLAALEPRSGGAAVALAEEPASGERPGSRQQRAQQRLRQRRHRRKREPGEKAMRILLVHPLDYLYLWGGAHKCDRALLRELAAAGYPCRLVALAGIAAHQKDTTALDRDEVVRRLRAQGVEIHRVGDDGIVASDQGVELFLTRGRRELESALIPQCRDFDPTWVVISEDAERKLVRQAIGHGYRNVVYIVHSPVTLPFGRDAALIDERQTEVMKHIAGAIVVSDYVGEEVRRHLPGIEPKTLHFPVYGSSPFPHLGRFDNEFVTMINPSAIKGLSIFVELARHVPEQRFAAVVTWAASSDERQALEAMENVHLLPPEDDIDRLFARCRILLVPSLWGEAFGLVVVEAMLRGVPVFASAHGGLLESKLGVDYNLPVRPIERYRPNPIGAPIPIVPPQDVTPWVEALRKVLGDRQHYEELSARSRAAALDFVGRLTHQPFVDYFEQLEPAAPPPAALRLDQPGKLRQAELSPAARALLARRLIEKKRRQAAAADADDAGDGQDG